MAKYFGKVGFGFLVETAAGVYEDKIVEREYYGDFIRTIGRPESAEKVNDNIKINSDISIVADPYANENFYAMKYVTYEGVKWKISAVQVQYPRLILSVGEVYNG